MSVDVESVLLRAAEQLGDITPLVMAHFQEHAPGAIASFSRHANGNKLIELKGSMVEQTVYCLMNFDDQPYDIEMIIDSTVANHLEFLDVEESAFSGLVSAVYHVVLETIPEENVGEIDSWRSVYENVRKLIDRSIESIRRNSNLIKINCNN